MNETRVNREQYFAALGVDEICSELMKRVEDYYTYLVSSGRIAIWRRSYEYYYRGTFRGAKILKAGDQGEYTTMHGNHFRNLLQHLIVMTTSQRPSFEPRATNTDYKSMAQVVDSAGILDYYMREKNMDAVSKLNLEDMLVFGEGEVSADWDATEGENFTKDPDTGQVVKQGDIVFQNYTPLEVVRDHTLPRASGATWKIVRDFKNKFDLAAKFPAKAEKILGLSFDTSRKYNERLMPWTERETDLIPVFRFVHDKTAALPQGRVVEFLSSDLWLIDAPLPYRRMSLYRSAASEQRGTAFGYSVAFDLLPVQEAFDGLVSTILTNQSTFGVQNILLPNGANISVSQLTKGLNVIKYDAKQGKPEGLNLTNTPPEIFKFLEYLEHLQETLSGVNSVARGNPEASLKSGAALALVQSMAIQFASGLQHAYATLLESLGTAVVNILQDFAKTPRMAAIAGKSKRAYMLEFSGKDISNINRVTVDLGNPLSRTTAGKVQMAENLLQAGLITEPDQYIQVLTTGNLEPMIEGKQAELMLVRSENEKLSEGETVMAAATDAHKLHIHEHKVVIASPESRSNPQILQNTLMHIQEHITLLRTTDPGLLTMIGETPIAPMMPPGMPPGGPPPGMAGPPPGTAPPEPGGESPEQAPLLDATPPMQTEAEKVNMPNMPNNPLTGERFNVVSGGL